MIENAWSDLHEIQALLTFLRKDLRLLIGVTIGIGNVKAEGIANNAMTNLNKLEDKIAAHGGER